MTLANTVFSILPGVFRPCPTLANAVFSILPGLRNENRPKYPLFFVLPVVAHIVTSISAPPTSFPAALRSSPRRQHHFQRRSSFHCAANVISSGAPLSTAPPTSFPAALHFSPHRQRHSQRRSTFHRAANVISSGAPLSPHRQRLFQRRSALHRTTTILHNSAQQKKATGKPVAILSKEHAQNCYFFRISIAFGVREF